MHEIRHEIPIVKGGRKGKGHDKEQINNEG